MKTPKILLAGLLAIASAGIASAQTYSTNVIHVVGSTAYRAPFTQSLIDLLSGTSGYGYAYYGNANIYKAGAAIFTGTLTISGTATPVVVETYWTGSLAGSVDVAVQNKLSNDFLSQTNTRVTTSPVSSSSPLSSPSYDNGTGSGVAPQVAMSDSFSQSVALSVSTAPNNGPTFATAIKSAHLTDGGTSGNASDAGTVGIVPFEWVTGALASGASAGGFSNISQQAALALLTSPVSVSFLTGATADASKYVLLIGRNEDSGTRIAGFAEPQFGFGGAPEQFAATFSGSTITTQSDGRQTGGKASALTGADVWPANAPVNTETALNWQTLGHSGYIAGGDVANVLLALNPTTAGTGASQVNVPSATFSPTITPTNFYLVAYISVADAQSVLTGNTVNGAALSYNGVPYNVAAVQDGQYTFWSYEHLFYQGSQGSTPLTGTLKSAADMIADKIFNTDADINSSGAHAAANAAGILYSGMTVNRGVEGGVVNSN